MQHLDEGTVHGWLDGALSPEEARRVEEHVAVCAECAAMVAEARGLIAASSRILGALDAVPGGVVPGGGQAGRRAGGQAVDGQRGGWVAARLLAASRLRAAAAIVVVAAGAAAMFQVTRERDSRAGFPAARPAAEMGARQDAPAAATAGERAVANVAPETSRTRRAAAEPSTSRATPERVAAAPRTAPARDARALKPMAEVATRRKAAAELRALGADTATAGVSAESSVPSAATTASGAAAERGAAAYALRARAARDAEGLRILSDSVYKANGRVVRRSVYEVRPGVLVVLEATSAPELSADTVGADQQMTKLEGAQPLSDEVELAQTDSAMSVEPAAAPPAPAPGTVQAPAVHSIHWVDAAGTEFTLSGPLSPEELQALRRRIPPPPPRRPPAAP